MRSRPRGRPDFRFRTPATQDFIQVPSATNAYVNVIQVNVTDAQELTWDFDAPLSTLGDCSQLMITTELSTSPDAAGVMGGTYAPTSAVDHSSEVAPGQSRIVATYLGLPGTLDPTNNLWVIIGADPQTPTFLGRRLGVGVAGQIFVP